MKNLPKVKPIERLGSEERLLYKVFWLKSELRSVFKMIYNTLELES
jgi:hypothetical protein